MILAPPTIVEELSVCSTQVRTQGQLRGARVDILIDGRAAPVGGGTADWPDQWFPLDPGVALQAGQIVRARQTLGADESAPGLVSATVQDRSTTRPQFVSPLVSCAKVAVIGDLAPGATVTVSAPSGMVLGSVAASGSRAVVLLSRIVLGGEILSATSSACGALAGPAVSSLRAEEMVRTPNEHLLTPAIVGDVRACMRILPFAGAQVGATLFLERDDGSIVSFAVEAGEFFARIDPELRPGETLKFWQGAPNERCQVDPSDRAVAVADPTPPGPPRVNAQPCPGARMLEIEGLVPSATVRILNGGVEVTRFEAAETRQSVDLGGVVLSPGDKLTVAQGLCAVFGATSPVPVNVTLPALDAMPGIPERLVECAGVVRVQGLAEGCLVEIFSDRLKGRIGHAFATSDTVDVLVSPPLLGVGPGGVKEHIRAEVSGCAGGTAEREVDPEVDLPLFTVAVPVDGDRSVAVSQVVAGCLVDVRIDGHWANSAWAGGTELRVTVPSVLREGQRVDVTTRLCSQRRSVDTVIVARRIELTWDRPSSKGIRTDSGAFMSGRVQAVLALTGPFAGLTLVGTEEAGLWTVRPGGPAFPLSMDWPTPLVRSLARGPRGPAHLFCGTTDGLRETDPAAALPLLSWQRVNGLPGPPPVLPGVRVPGGVINEILVLAGRSLIVIATDSGLWWSPTQATVAAGYVWSSAPLVSEGSFIALCEGPGESIVAYRSNVTDFMVGQWVGSALQWSTTTPTGAPPADARLVTVAANMTTGTLASAPSDRRRIYAGLADTADMNGNIPWLAVLRSDDGGLTWSIPYADPTLTYFKPGGTVDLGFQADRNMRIGVHPLDPNLVLLAARRSGLLGSRDGARSWDPDTWGSIGDSFHADCLSISFDPNDATGNTVLVGSDGGIFSSADQGVTWDSTRNAALPTLMFDQRSSPVDPALSASSGFPGVLVGALQDNGNVYLPADGENWRELFDGGDGSRALFVTPDVVLRGGNDGVDIKWSRWDGDAFTAPVPLAPPAPEGSQFLPILSRVPFPTFKDAPTAALMVAVGGDDPPTGDVFGLFDKGAGTDPVTDRFFWKKLGTVPAEIAGLGSLAGRFLLVGTVDARLFRLDTLAGTVDAIPLPAGGPNTDMRCVTVAGPTTAFCIAGNTLLRSTNLVDWSAVAGPPASTLAVLAVDYGLDPIGLIAAGSDGAWFSRDLGTTWQPTTGLPKHPQANHLEVVDYGVNGRFVHLGTWNWSAWRARLA